MILYTFHKWKITPRQIILKNCDSLIPISLPWYTCSNSVNLTHWDARMIHQFFNTLNNLFKHLFSIRGITVHNFPLNDISLLIYNTTCNRRSSYINSNGIIHRYSSFKTTRFSLYVTQISYYNSKAKRGGRQVRLIA